MRKGCRETQATSGVHVWLVLAKAFRALAAHAEESLNLSRTGLGDSDFRGARSSAPPGTIAGQYNRSKSVAHAGIDQCRRRSAGEESACERKNTGDRRVRLVELTAKGRALITKTFREHAAAVEEATGVHSQEERQMRWAIPEASIKRILV
jgi:MarR family 2-MHQ and catechol resistance regulon transcriptional repressor